MVFYYCFRGNAIKSEDFDHQLSIKTLFKPTEVSYYLGQSMKSAPQTGFLVVINFVHSVFEILSHIVQWQLLADCVTLANQDMP